MSVAASPRTRRSSLPERPRKHLHHKRCKGRPGAFFCSSVERGSRRKKRRPPAGKDDQIGRTFVKRRTPSHVREIEAKSSSALPPAERMPEEAPTNTLKTAATQAD